MQFNTRGVLLLSAVALITLKLAGVLNWPWLAILLPALIYALPFIWTLASMISALALGAVVMVCVVIAAACASLHDAIQTRRWLKRRQAQLKAGAVQGPWDRAA